MVAAIGAGGMGEVYRARDTRLDRTVAIKILPSHLSATPEVRERFDREARTISRVTHPNICTLFDVGHQDGISFLVMELIEGETLADRLARGPLPLRDVLRIGAEIAAALERAHREGIVHRDLKPGNVMLARSGAKVVDFGLSKQDVSSIAGVSNGATVHKPITEEGTVLGTLHYMAPEQLEGKPADARTDLFALGVILYEMTTGRRPFNATSRTGIIALILEHDPEPVSALQPMTPPALEQVVRTSLEKDPEQRWQTAHDVRLQLQAISSGETASRRAHPAKRPATLREWIAWGAALAGLAAAMFFAARGERNGGGAFPVRLSIIIPSEHVLPELIHTALSPDARRVAYIAPTASADSMLWVRPLGGFEARPLAGTEDASFPFWSPDSRFIAFFAEGKLKKIPAEGGAVQRLADAPAGRGGTWSRDDVIVFAPTLRGPLHRVAATGGKSSPAIEVPDVWPGTRRWPSFLPDGKRFLYFAVGIERPRGIYMASLDDPEERHVTDSLTQAVFVEPGHLVTAREGVLVAQAFDPDARQVSGPLVAIGESVATSIGFNFADFSLARDGTIAFKESDIATSQLTWFDRRGAMLGTVGKPGVFLAMRLSPKNDRVLVIRADPGTRTGDVWVEEIGRDAPQRLTFRDRQTRGLAWSPDQQHIAYGQSPGNTPLDVFRKPVGDPSQEQPVITNPSLEMPNDWSPDGKYILAQQIRDGTLWDLVIAPADGKEPEKTWIGGPFNEMTGRFSPDGEWVAYVSNESGRNEVYVRPFPGPGTATRVSHDGGVMPVWRRDGRELFFLSPRLELMASAVTRGATLSFAAPAVLFRPAVTNLFIEVDVFDAAADGERFLVNARVGNQVVNRLNILMNWRGELEGR
ncbi:MAG TPA: protein kinase [Thermoanaerobaculia bacterium]|nr:protein kinase [Thermoanaerobaculia bacterium]